MEAAVVARSKKRKKRTPLSSGSSKKPTVSRKVELGAKAGMPLFLQRSASSATPQVLQQQVGEEKDKELLHPKLTVGQPGDVFEQEADRVAKQVMRMPNPTASSNSVEPQPTVSSSLQNHITALQDGGQPLPQSERDFFEPRLGGDLSQVRIHTDKQAAEASRAVNARAFTVGQDVVFGAGQYQPRESKGQQLLAHELAHVMQHQRSPNTSPVLKRETATEVRDRYTNWRGLNLQEDRLAAYLVTLTRRGQYGFVREVINVLAWTDRDDVAGEMMAHFTTRQLIRMARNEDAVHLLRVMRGAIGDRWGWVTAGERHQADLLGAVLNEPGKRNLWNWERIRVIKSEAGTDLEALARIFEDDEIIDDDSVTSRLQSILGATEHLIIPGLQTGIDFADTGFAGEQTPGGAGFRDPHASSRNQVGHFLTAVGLQFSPGVVSRSIPFFGTIRSMVQAPASMSDADVALRLTIGHEKAPDPNGTMAAINIVLTGLIEHWSPQPEGETEEQRQERVGRAILSETQRQINEIITAFRTQFQAATDADVQAWNEALTALGRGNVLNIGAAEAPLSRISINPAGRGNSIQDLRLSLVGWQLGQLISSGAFGDRAAVARWIRTNLGPPPSP
ncbi:MAG: DUF4157 domain-containing protein [Xenococcaceae cyanobacterium MO_234.B1]|nr:DUF4157 domain-containing protein [Xenococcaceae cyanobacterium MO_234.B1]